MLKVTYIEHSGYFVELDECCLLFDYYRGDIPLINKPLYVFVSHHHSDHYNHDIYNLDIDYPHINYIIADDIKINEGQDNILVVAAHKHYKLDKLDIYTLKSNDEGVAFIVRTCNKTIYFAGDLNPWLWEDNTKDENLNSYLSYIKEIDMIKAVEFDLAFIVLDPRLKQFATVGIDYFINNCKAKRIFPMHFWHEHNIVLNYASNHQEVIKLKHPQSTFVF